MVESAFANPPYPAYTIQRCLGVFMRTVAGLILFVVLNACGGSSTPSTDADVDAGIDTGAEATTRELPTPDESEFSNLDADIFVEISGDVVVDSVGTDVHPPEMVVNLAADTNRNGVVEFDQSDEKGEDKWTSGSGAVFIVNADDDDGDGVRDWEDDIINGPADVEDLARLNVQPMAYVEKGAYAVLRAEQGGEHVRLFRQAGDSWTAQDLGSTVTLTAGALSSGVVRFGLEGLHFPGEYGFDGKLVLTLTLYDHADAEINSDTVHLRCAPLVLTSGNAPASEVFVAWSLESQGGFVQAMQSALVGLNYTFTTVGELGQDPLSSPINNDIWMQDAVEIGFTSLPAAGDPHVVHVALQAPRGKPLDKFSADVFAGPDSGWLSVAEPREDSAWFDWFGNLEVTPPLLHDEAYNPYGRIYTGMDPDDPGFWCMHPEVEQFLEAQDMQGPIVHLDTGWLLIGHVDEIVSWIPWSGGPGCCGKGFILLLASTADGVQILKDVQTAGQGKDKLFAGTGDEITVDALLADQALMDFNLQLQERLDGVQAVLVEQFKLDPEEDVITIPTLFEPDETWGQYAVALVPNMVNSLVLGKLFISADPHGPVINGVDPFKQALIDKLEPYSQVVVFVDNWYPYHKWSGEIHCGTNARRLPTNLEWWLM